MTSPHDEPHDISAAVSSLALDASQLALLDDAGDARATMSFAARRDVPPEEWGPAIGGLPAFGSAGAAAWTVPPVADADASDAPSLIVVPPPEAPGGAGGAGASSSSFTGSTFGRADSEGTTARRGVDLAGAGGGTPEFVLHRRVGEGGMGEVWQAWQASLDRTVAVKRLKRGDPVEFLQEAYLSAELDHPNIVPVHDLGRIVVDDGGEAPLLAMKLVEGKPWSAHLAEERRAGAPREEFLARHLRILVDVCQAVAFAHARTIVHRDLKPSQVMVGAFGEVYLMDWGLAMSLRAEAVPSARAAFSKYPSRANASNQCGSPAYMAPEQTEVSVEGIGTHTDVYLLGAILFEILSGRPPHHAPSARQAFFRAASNELLPLPDDVPEDLRDLVLAALATDPRDRPPSVVALRDALEDHLTGASRRRESAQIVAEVQARVGGEEGREMAVAGGDGGGGAWGTAAEGAPSLDYPELTALRQRTQRALQLWPESHEAARLDRRLTILHARRALTERDLRLAESLAASLPPDEGERDRLIAEAGAARALIARRDRERRLLAAASLLLVAIALGAGFLARDGALRAASEAANRRAADAERHLATQRAEEKERLAELLRAIDELRTDEAQLASDLLTTFAIPESLDALDTRRARLRADVAALDDASDLLARREAVGRRRAALVAGLPADVVVAELPDALARGEALVRLALDATAADNAATRALFEGLVASRPDDPELLLGVGLTHYLDGDPMRASAAFRAAADLAREQHGEASPLRLNALAMAGDAWRRLDVESDDYARHFRESLAILEPRWADLAATIAGRVSDLGDVDHALAITSSTLAVIEGRADIPPLARLRLLDAHAGALLLKMDFPGAREAYLRTIDVAGATLDAMRAEGGDLGRPLSFLAGAAIGAADVERQLGDTDSAIRRLNDVALPALDDLPTSGALHESVLVTLANTHASRGEFDASFVLHQRTVELRRGRLGDAHPQTAFARVGLGQSLMRLGRWEEAKAEFDGGIAILSERLGRDHPQTLASLTDLGQNLHHLNRPHEAVAVYEELSERLRDSPWRDTFLGAVVQNNHAMMLIDIGRQDDAIPRLRGVLRAIRAVFGDAHPHTATVLKNMADVAFLVGDHPLAWRCLMASQRIALGVLGEAHPDWHFHLISVSQLLTGEGRGEEGLLVARHALDATEAIYGVDHPRYASLQALLLVALARCEPVEPRRELRQLLAMQSLDVAREGDDSVLHRAGMRLGQVPLFRGLARRALLVEGEPFGSLARRSVLSEAIVVELLGLPDDAAERDGWLDDLAASKGWSDDLARVREAARAAASELWGDEGRALLRASFRGFMEGTLGPAPPPPFDDLDAFSLRELHPEDGAAARAATLDLLARLEATTEGSSLDDLVAPAP